MSRDFRLYVPVKLRHQYFSRCLASVSQYGDKIVLVERPDLTFSQTMNWIQADAVSRRLDLFFWMHTDAECERDVIAEMLATDDWDIHFTNVDALSATKIEVARRFHWDEGFTWYYSDTDFYRRVKLAGLRIKNDSPHETNTDDWHRLSSNGVTHHHKQTCKNMSVRDRWMQEKREKADRQRYIAKWGGDNGRETLTCPAIATVPSSFPVPSVPDAGLVERAANGDVWENVALNTSERLDRKPVLKSYPIRFYVELTQKCNLNCVTCYKGSKAKKPDMPQELFDEVERQLFPHVAEVNFFLTGESPLAKSFCRQIGVSSKYQFLPKLFTNGTVWPDANINLMAELGVFVNVSLDAASPGLFRWIRTVDLDVVVRNIRKMVAVQKASGNDRFHIRVASTMASYNAHEAPKIVELCANLGVRDIMFGGYDYAHQEWKLMSADEWKLTTTDEWKLTPAAVPFLMEAKELATRKGIRFSCPRMIGDVVITDNNNWDSFSLPVDRHAPFVLEGANPYGGNCGYPWIQSAVKVDGTVVSCCQRQHVMGNMFDSSFLDIWNGSKYQNLRSQSDYRTCLGNKCNLAVFSIWRNSDEPT